MLIVRIHNDGTGTHEMGNYDVDVAVTTSPRTFKVLWKGRVERHPRAEDWRALLKRVIAAK